MAKSENNPEKKKGYTIPKTMEEALYDTLEWLYKHPDDPRIKVMKTSIQFLGSECYGKGGNDNMKHVWEAVTQKLASKYKEDFDKYRMLWNGICDEWKY